MDISDIELKNRMLEEMNYVVETSDSVGWSVAKDIFADLMHRIEDRALLWSDSWAVLQARVQATQRAWMAGGKQSKGHNSTHSNYQRARPLRQYACWHYNHSECDRGRRHFDKGGKVEFLHICQTCEEQGIRDWDHPAWACHATRQRQHHY